MRLGGRHNLSMASLRLVIASCLIAVLLAFASNARAIVGGEEDASPAHSYAVFVGELTGAKNACSGVLVSPTVVVTAAHCGFTAGEPFIVRQGPNFRDPKTYTQRTGTYTPHPDFSFGGNGLPHFAENDLAVIRLTAPLEGPYAQLPEAGAVDALRPNTDLEVIGYGVSEMHGKEPVRFDGLRRSDDAQLLGQGAVGDSFVHFRGGVCLGDSGGPIKEPGSDVVLAITSFAPSACDSTSYGTRLDTPAARSFLSQFLG